LITDANGFSTSFDFNHFGKKTLISFPNGSFISYDYDPVGNLTKKTNQDGITISYVYDKLNRLILRDYPGNNDDSFEYDPNGNLISALNAQGLISITYDSLNRKTAESFKGLNTKYIYSKNHKKQTTIYPSNLIVDETYDENGNLKVINKNGQFLANFQYDELGREKSRFYNNNASSSFTFDQNGRIIRLSHHPQNFIDEQISYDSVGNITSRSFLHNPINSEQYVYDKNNRLIIYKKGLLENDSILTPHKKTTWSYDPVGNRSMVTQDSSTSNYSINNMNQYTSISTEEFLSLNYDQRGNLISDGINTYEYDLENRIKIISSGSGNDFLNINMMQ
jgi:YD repeat-containing protein